MRALMAWSQARHGMSRSVANRLKVLVEAKDRQRL